MHKSNKPKNIIKNLRILFEHIIKKFLKLLLFYYKLLIKNLINYKKFYKLDSHLICLLKKL